MRWPRKVSQILQTSVKFSKNHRENAPKLFHTQVFHRIRKTILQPSPSWEVTWRKHDHNALWLEDIKTHSIGWYMRGPNCNGGHNCNATPGIGWSKPTRVAMIWLRVKVSRKRLCTAVARNEIKDQKSRESGLFQYKLYACAIACLSFISLMTCRDMSW